MATCITVLSWHTVFTIGVIYKFTLMWYSAKQGTTHRPTSHLAHLYTVPFLWPREEYRQQRSWADDFAGQCLLWRLLSHKTFFDSESVSATRISQMASSLSVIFFPGHCNRHLQWSALFTPLCMTGHSRNNLMPLRYVCLLQWQKNRSQAVMWLLYKIPAIRGCSRCF